MKFLLTLGLASVLLAQPARDRHVVIVSIDGLAAYSLNDKSVPLPNLRALAKAGASASAMTVVNPSVTWPNHTSIVIGGDAGEARHALQWPAGKKRPWPAR